MKKIVAVSLALVLVFAMMVSASAITLRKGSSGTLVKEVQQFLNEKNYGKLTVDGKYGTATMEAVKRYQEANKLTADGICGSRTLQKMEAQGLSTTNNNPEGEPGDDGDDELRVMSLGSTGSNVRAVQTRLKALGYPVGSVDGTYGAKTLAAVRAFQSLNNMTKDGKVGPKTYAQIMSEDATPYNASYNPDLTYTVMSTKKNNSGALVKKLQKALEKAADTLGFSLPDDFAVTSFYGEATRDAVKAFQEAKGLAPDGVAGKETQAALYAVTGVQLGK